MASLTQTHPAQVPKGRKVTAFSNPQLVTIHRQLFKELAVAKLTGKPYVATENYLNAVVAELKRRNITINHPELDK